MVKRILEVKKLKKSFGNLIAVDEISFFINEGEIVALLGPNGAGKTTTIRCLTTLSKPDSKESVLIVDLDLYENLSVSRKLIGVCPQELNLYKDSTVEENLKLQGYLYKINSKEVDKRVPELLKIVELEDKSKELVKNLSGGMKRRLQIARSLISNPKLVFLDEPTTGLSPETRKELWEYIKSLKNKGISLLLTTHYMEEAEQLADRILIMNKGKIIVEGTADELKEKIIGPNQVIVSCSNHMEVENRLKQMNLSYSLNNESEISVKNINGKFSDLFKYLEGLEINELALKKPTLEDVFLELTGSKFREVDTIKIGDA